MRRILIILLFITQAALADSALNFFVPKQKKSQFKKEYGDQAEKRLNSLLILMDSLKNSSEDEIVIKINSFFNQIPYSSDIKVWKKSDYWATRLEFIGKGLGDCEDFAVSKFLTLVQLGVPQKKLFLTYVKAIGYPETAHLVVTYYKKPGTIPFVLDNYDKRILPATKRRDLVPVYSFTANDLYLQKQQGLGKRINRKDLKTQKNLKEIDLEIIKRKSK